MKSLGVIGGLGPLASAYFLELLIDMTDAKTDQEHLDVILFDRPAVPDRTAYLLGQGENPLPQMQETARTLENLGAACIAIPCVTSHALYRELSGAVGIPILHMVEETAAYLEDAGIHKAGILATDGTVRTGIYQRECAGQGVEAVVPGPQAQALTMSIIYDEIKRGESGSREKFAAIDRDLRSRGCDGAILACTELSVYKEYHGVSELYLDAMDVLAEESIRACGYPLRSV